jgi:hypothetical protein
MVDELGVDEMGAKLRIGRGRREGDAPLGDEDAASNVFAANLYSTLLTGPREKAQHLIERDESQVSGKSHLNHSLYQDLR